jgi:glyoxylase-like metal-dependent hydrolase (beta-lactamase superfamily II)
MRPRELSSSIAMFPARTPTLPPATHTNSYALGGRDVVLVEPATPHDDEQRAWLDWARALPSQGRRPIAIFATHHHPDHVGGAAVFARELTLPLWAHPLTATRIDVPVARLLNDGDELVLTGPRDEKWTVLHTPGHAPGHVCLWEQRSRTLVVGDMVASVGTILIAPGDGDMTIYLEQLRRLVGCDASLALPAHGDPIDAPSELFEHYIAHRLKREGKVLDAIRAAGTAGSSMTDLVPVAYADTPAHLWPIAKLSLECHLEKLEGEGKVARTSGGGFRACDRTNA